MSWARFDDLFHGNRKVKRAWKQHRASIGLHAMAITYCAGHATDGFVDAEFVEEKLPRANERKAATKALVDAGMWIPCDDGWSIHDFLDFHPSSVEEKARKESLSRVRSEAGRKGGQARSGKQTGKQTPGKLVDVNEARLSPVPTRPDLEAPLAPKGGRKRDHDSFDEEMSVWAAEHFPSSLVGDVQRLAARVRDVGWPATPEAMREYVERHPVWTLTPNEETA